MGVGKRTRSSVGWSNERLLADGGPFLFILTRGHFFHCFERERKRGWDGERETKRNINWSPCHM